MGIRERENNLFAKWQTKYTSASFVIDGCPNPPVYGTEKRKIVFVLKDGNLGEPGNTEGIEIYDQRDELENEPTLWWSTLARWCYFLKNPDATWAESLNVITDSKSIKEILKYYCIVQLKKTWGQGSVKNEALETVVLNDKVEIISQLSIYTPNFIIACGNGDQLSKLFDCKRETSMETTYGIRYWQTELDNSKCVLIDFCHPSIRVGTKVKGLIARGLLDAIIEIESIMNVQTNLLIEK
jgi:hypothetical protein